MGTKYTGNLISGYNASKPPDDGSTGTDNLVTWAKHIDKIGDPLKDLAQAINTDLVAFADNTPTAKAPPTRLSPAITTKPSNAPAVRRSPWELLQPWEQATG